MNKIFDKIQQLAFTLRIVMTINYGLLINAIKCEQKIVQQNRFCYINLQLIKRRRQMVKKRTQSTQKSSDKTKFILKPKHPKCQKGSLSLDFKPDKKDLLYKDFKGMALFPIFNNDRKHFTPAFVMKCLERLGSDEDLIQLHEKKVHEYTSEIDEDKILVPKPRSKHMYCGVCREGYEDYYVHVQSDQHRQQTRNSRYTKYINQLSIRFNPHLQKQHRRHIQTQLQDLEYKYKAEDLNQYLMSSYQTLSTKSRKDTQKKESSLSCSQNHNRTTIVLSSD